MFGHEAGRGPLWAKFSSALGPSNRAITETQTPATAELSFMPLSADSDLHAEQAVKVPLPLDFDAVYAEHFAFVWRNLRRLGVREGSLRDAAQDVFLVVHRRLSDFEGRGTVQSFLYSIVRRVAADHRRRLSRKALRDADDLETVADARSVGPEQEAVRGEALRLLLHLLERLDPDKREVLILAELEAMTIPEIAAALESNVNTIYSRLRAARKLMREGYERHHAERRRSP